MPSGSFVVLQPLDADYKILGYYFKEKTIDFKIQRKMQKFKLVGVPFYNYEDENKFKQSLYEVLIN